MKFEIVWFILKMRDDVLPIGHEYVAVVPLEALCYLCSVSE